jgi:ubiquinone/menaquinone biosynthesis C-methylase UbiE
VDTVAETIRSYDAIAPCYCAKTREKEFLLWEEEYIGELLASIPVRTPLILDVGCGDGRHSVVIEKPGGGPLGIDLSQGMLRESQTLFPGGVFCKMDMRCLAFRDNCFDGIWASGSLYHVEKSDAQIVAWEFARLLKPGGVATVNFKLGTGEGMEQNPKSYGGFPRYFAYYTETEMTGLFSGCGFLELKACRFPREIYGNDICQMWFQLKDNRTTRQ